MLIAMVDSVVTVYAILSLTTCTCRGNLTVCSSHIQLHTLLPSMDMYGSFVSCAVLRDKLSSEVTDTEKNERLVSTTLHLQYLTTCIYTTLSVERQCKGLHPQVHVHVHVHVCTCTHTIYCRKCFCVEHVYMYMHCIYIYEIIRPRDSQSNTTQLRV